jgi:hypothetical protein
LIGLRANIELSVAVAGFEVELDDALSEEPPSLDTPLLVVVDPRIVDVDLLVSPSFDPLLFLVEPADSADFLLLDCFVERDIVFGLSLLLL